MKTLDLPLSQAAKDAASRLEDHFADFPWFSSTHASFYIDEEEEINEEVLYLLVKYRPMYNVMYIFDGFPVLMRSTENAIRLTEASERQIQGGSQGNRGKAGERVEPSSPDKKRSRRTDWGH